MRAAGQATHDRIMAAAKDGAEHQRIRELADNGRADQPRPQVALLGAFLHAHHDEGVKSLSDKISGEAGDHERGDAFDNRGERLLVGVELGRRQYLGGPQHQAGQCLHHEPEQNHPIGGAIPVDLAEYVAATALGIHTLGQLATYTALGWVFKSVVEIVMLPVTYRVIAYIKKNEPTYTQAK